MISVWLILVLYHSPSFLVSGKGLFSSSLRKIVEDHSYTLFIRWWPIFPNPSDISKSSSKSKTACILWKDISAEPWVGDCSAHGSCSRGSVPRHGKRRRAGSTRWAFTALWPVLLRVVWGNCMRWAEGSSSARRSSLVLRAQEMSCWLLPWERKDKDGPRCPSCWGGERARQSQAGRAAFELCACANSYCLSHAQGNHQAFWGKWSQEKRELWIGAQRRASRVSKGQCHRTEIKRCNAVFTVMLFLV